MGPHSYHSFIPSAIIAFTEPSQRTGLVSCFFMLTTISAGGVPGRTGFAVAFIHTVVLGGFMFGKVSSKAA